MTGKEEAMRRALGENAGPGRLPEQALWWHRNRDKVIVVAGSLAAAAWLMVMWSAVMLAAELLGKG